MSETDDMRPALTKQEREALLRAARQINALVEAGFVTELYASFGCVTAERDWKTVVNELYEERITCR